MKIEKEKSECKKCNLDENECNKYSLGKNIVCDLCKKCRKCIKDTKDCNKCCIECKRCKKKMLKDNWPEDIIISNYCEKCYHLCKNCERYFHYNDLYYKKKNLKYCQKCFEIKYLPNDSDKYKYKIILKKEEYGNKFLSWKKTHELLNCKNCNKQFENYIHFNKILCKSCLNKIKPLNKKIINPSTYDKIYVEDKNKWILKSQRIKCINCYSSIWIELKNLKNDQNYRCKNCPPNLKDVNKKFKYDKNLQNWIVYRKKTICKKCNEKKWIFTNINKNGYCMKCTKN